MQKIFRVINIVMDSAILNQLNNIEKEVNSEGTKSKRGRKRKTDTKINKEEDNDIIEKRDRLIACVLSGNSKQYLGKEYTEQQINEMDGNDMIILSNRYESVLSAQMTKSLGKSVRNLYSNVACSVLGIDNQQDLSNNLECDPFLNTAMKRFTCHLYYCFGTFLAPISVGKIVGKHYTKISGTKIKTDQTMETVNQQQETVKKTEEPSENGTRKEIGCKKEELKRLNEHIMKQDDMIERKPVELSNNYLYISGVSVIGIAIAGYLLYKRFKRPKQNLIDLPPPSNVSNVDTKIELKRDIFEMY